jgi:hypothetical protein
MHPLSYENFRKELTNHQIKRRKTVSDVVKLRVLSFWDSNPGLNSVEVSIVMGFKSRQLRKWKKARWKFTKNRFKERKADFVFEEDELYQRFIFRRRVLHRWVDSLWLRLTMKNILKQTRPPGWNAFKGSNGWAWNFCKRFNLSTQCKTDGKSETQEVREPKIRDQHLRYLALQQGLPQTHWAWGHFLPNQHWSWDQIPLPFSVPRRRSLNPKGEHCHISQSEFLGATGKSECGLSKRQATLHLTLRSQGPQIVPAVVIFKGKTPFRSQRELSEYEALHNVRVYFNKKAWVDTKFMLWFLKEVFCPALLEHGLLGQSQLCIMDGLSSHKTEPVKDFMRENQLFDFITAPGCTDVSSPVDHHVGALFKQLIRSSYEKAVETNSHLWRGDGDGGLESVVTGAAASERRILMAKWVSIAWANISVRSDFLLKSFLSTGCLMMVNGENHVKMRGFPDYKIFP